MIHIDFGRVTGQVDRRILGGFTEHLGRCIYGGIFDEGSPLADSEGFRTDVLEAVRRLAPPVLRWPGGNFASAYHWADGIGPRDQRPRRLDLAWQAEEPNRFGTDEFMRLCELVGAEPYLCLNMGTGTMDEAQAWLEYCNGTGGTEWVRRRRDNGREEPYRVRYLALGNEMYGNWQIGQLPAADYVTRARQFAAVLTQTDPSVELVACGHNGWSDWDQEVIPGLADLVRWYSIHLYSGGEAYWRNMLEPLQAQRAIQITAALIEKARYTQRIGHPLHIAYDEWGVWYREWDGTTGLEERYTVADALAVTTYLHVFVRHSRAVKMANLAQLVNVIAPIVTSPDGLFLQTIYHPLRLFAEHLGKQAVDVHTECQRREFTNEQLPGPRPDHRIAGLGPFPVLDVVATRSGPAVHQFMISVINRSPDEDITAEFDIRGLRGAVHARIDEVSGPSWDTVNSFAEPDAVTVGSSTVRRFGDGSRHTFPAHSVTVITAA